MRQHLRVNGGVGRGFVGGDGGRGVGGCHWYLVVDAVGIDERASDREREVRKEGGIGGGLAAGSWKRVGVVRGRLQQMDFRLLSFTDSDLESV